jgi:hypothetical protein
MSTPRPHYASTQPYAAQKARRAEQRAETVGLHGPARSARVDLGLAIFACHRLPGVQYTRAEIAEWAGVTEGAIWVIERKAIHKLRRALHLRGDRLLAELLTGLFEERRPARRALPMSGALSAAE